MTAATVAVSLIWNGVYLNGALIVAMPPILMSLAVCRSTRTGTVSQSAAKLYAFELFFPYVWIAAFSIAGSMPLATVMIFLTLPIAIACATTMKNSVTGGPQMIADLDARTANLQRLFCILFMLSFIFAKLYTLYLA